MSCVETPFRRKSCQVPFMDNIVGGKSCEMPFRDYLSDTVAVCKTRLWRMRKETLSSSHCNLRLHVRQRGLWRHAGHEGRVGAGINMYV